MFCVVPFVIIVVSLYSWANSMVSAPLNRLEGAGSSFIEQILSSVRSVQSFDMASRLVQSFDRQLLARMQKVEDKRSILRSLKHATLMFTVLGTYALAFWFGGIEVGRGLTVGKVMTVSCTATITRSIDYCCSTVNLRYRRHFSIQLAQFSRWRTWCHR